MHAHTHREPYSTLPSRVPVLNTPPPSSLPSPRPPPPSSSSWSSSSSSPPPPPFSISVCPSQLVSARVRNDVLVQRSRCKLEQRSERTVTRETAWNTRSVIKRRKDPKVDRCACTPWTPPQILQRAARNVRARRYGHCACVYVCVCELCKGKTHVETGATAADSHWGKRPTSCCCLGGSPRIDVAIKRG